jgi:putative inorganic carbon (hco3(-)) transporter
MRDILITALVIIGCCYTFKKPHYGVYVWSWLSYMNPHRLAYGFSYSAPFAYIVAIVLIISMALSKETQKPPMNLLVWIWLGFIVFMGITTLYAYFPDAAKPVYIKVIKIQLIIFLTMMLIANLNQLNKLLWVIVLSIGFYSVKGGVFTLLTGGSFIVWGPPESYIEDNNSLAVAILMIVPFMLYLRFIEQRQWVKQALLAAIVFSLFTVLGSQSRGALLAIIAVALFYWQKSQRKLVSGLFVGAIGFALISFMPDSWFKRMDTMNHYEQDGSAMGRINAWHYAYNAANDNLLGLGFESWSPHTFALYAPNPKDVHAAHSIYFSVLADHGWIGLLFFLAIYAIAWIKLSAVVKVSAKQDNLKDYHFLAKMLQVSLIAYLVGGAFLSLSYFDLPWHLVSFVVLLADFVQKEKAKLQQSAIPIKQHTLHLRRSLG